MKRRDFFIRFGGALVAVPAVLQLTACGDDGGGGSADAMGNATSFDVSSTMSGHTHQVTVQCADLSSSSDVTYTSTSSNSHTHQVTITAADLATVMGGGSVTVMTTDGGHSHGWTIAVPTGAC